MRTHRRAGGSLPDQRRQALQSPRRRRRFHAAHVATDRAKGSRGGISASSSTWNAPGVKLACYETMMATSHGKSARECARAGEDASGRKAKACAFGQQWLNIGRVKHGARALASPSDASRWQPLMPNSVRFGSPLASAGGAVDAGDMFIELQARDSSSTEPRPASNQGEEAREDAYVGQILRRRKWRSKAPTSDADPRRHCAHHHLPIEKMWRQQRSYPHHRRRERGDEMVIARQGSRPTVRTLLKVCRRPNAVYSLAPRSGRGWGGVACGLEPSPRIAPR